MFASQSYTSQVMISGDTKRRPSDGYQVKRKFQWNLQDLWVNNTIVIIYFNSSYGGDYSDISHIYVGGS